MARARPGYRCSDCDYRSVKALGKCPNCGAWGSFVEEEIESPAITTTRTVPASLVRLSGIVGVQETRFSSQISELDRVLGGGFVAGEVLLLGGEPGIGKSTLLLQVAHQLLAQSLRVLYLAGEESASQVAMRAQRLGVDGNLELVRETELQSILALLEVEKPAFLIVDSIQTLEAGSTPGSLVSVREGTAALTRIAKRLGITTLLVGHVTKEGTVAGPKVIEHVVDATLYLESAGHFRVLRSAKNRFGPVGEMGVFEMDESGMREVANPSAAFLAERPIGSPGSVVGLSLSGERALALEVQALAARTPFPAPRRVSQGLDARRVDVVLAVLERRLDLTLGNLDLYVNLAGGMRILDPGLDLAIAAAVYSAVVGRPVPAEVALVGEVGLAGELRRVEGLERRLREGERAGFTRLMYPGKVQSVEETLRLLI